MGSSVNFQLKFLLLGSGRVGSAIFGMGLGLENFPYVKLTNFSTFSHFGSKKSHRVGSKSSRVSLFFTAGQKYVGVGSVPISSITSLKVNKRLDVTNKYMYNIS